MKNCTDRERLHLEGDDNVCYGSFSVKHNANASKSTRVSIRKLCSNLSTKDLFMLGIGSLCAVVHGAFRPLLALVFGVMTNASVDVLTKGDGGGQAMAAFTPIYIYLGVVTLVVTLVQVVSFEWACEKIIYNLQIQFLAKVLHQHIGWHDEQSAGRLSSQLTDDVERIKEGIGHKLSLILQSLSTIVCGFAVSLYCSWELTLVILVLSPFLSGTTWFIGRFTASTAAKEQIKFGEASAVAEQGLSALKTVVSFGGEQRLLERYENLLNDAMQIAFRKSEIVTLTYSGVHFVLYTSYAIILWFGCHLLLRDEITAGEIFTVIFAGLGSTSSIANTLPLLSLLNTAQGSAEGIYRVLESTSPRSVQNSTGFVPRETKGRLQFQSVYFSYPGRPDAVVFSDFNLDVASTTSIAIVGPSGAGKSTLVNLLLGFYEPTHGRILLDGVDIRDLNLSYLRSQMGVVYQEPILFSGTIYENILLGSNNNASYLEVVEASVLANAHEFVSKLPEKYNTLVGDRGSQLSGGQKQRIAIARALLGNPRILILDEATSALDNESEKRVQEALSRSSKGRTTLIIAHRLSTIKMADIIYFLKDGRILEAGNHDELMKLKGHYFEHVHIQAQSLVGNAYTTQALKSKEGDTSDQIHLVLSSTAEHAKPSPATPPSHRGLKNQSMWRLLKVMKPEWHKLSVGFLATALIGTHVPITGYIYGQMFNVFTLTGEALQSAGLFWSLVFLAISILASIVNLLRGFIMGKANEVMAIRLRLSALRSIISQSVSWFDVEENSYLRVLTRLSRDVAIVRGACSLRILFLIISTVTIVTSLILAFVSAWQLACVLTLVFPLLILSGYMETAVLGKAATSHSVSSEIASKVATEAIQHIRTVQSLVAETAFIQKYEMYLQQILGKAKKGILVYGLTFSGSESVLCFSYALSFLLGGMWVDAGLMAVSNVYAAFFSTAICASALGQMMSNLPDYAKAKHAAKLTWDLIDMKSDMNVFNQSGFKPNFGGKITFTNVDFSYPTRPDYQILKGMNFKVEAGKTLGIIGVSGCGKSTIINLLERFYDVSNGAVRIDDWDIRDLNVAYLRSNLGLVTQEPQTFNISIRDNIAYGYTGVEPLLDADIIESARLANAHEFIMDFPEGYNTMLGEHGIGLSGGQKQRIAIARALIRKPKILLLDEATSALDSTTEEVVQNALDKARVGRTCILIAHRLSTVRKADAIAVVQDGRIAEIGSHDELFNLRGIYHKLITSH